MTPRIGVASWFLPVRGADAIGWAARAGFELLQVDMFDVQASGASRLRSIGAETGVELSGLSVSTLETVGVHGPAGYRAVDEALSIAGYLGIGFVYLPSFGSARIESLSDLQATACLLVHAAEQGSEAGITIATENDLSAEDLDEFFALVDRDDVELLFDTQNLAAAGLSAGAVLRYHRYRVRSCVHVKDGFGVLGETRLGSGNAEIAESIDLLLSSGFDGQFVIESDYREASMADVDRDQTWLTERFWRVRQGLA